ncbi:hypothetical protein BGZ83_000127, partial [Gryganskiella cystojenkinii]
YQCAHVRSEQIQVVMEPASCTYVMVIYSPMLCQDQAFESIAAPDANNIGCRPIVSDEEFLRLPPTSQEAIGSGLENPQETNQRAGKAASSVFDDSFGLDGLSQRLDEMMGETNYRTTDDIFNELETLAEALKPLLTESQQDTVKRLENALKGMEFGDHNIAVQPIDLEALLGSNDKEKGKSAAEDAAKEKQQKHRGPEETGEQRIKIEKKFDLTDLFEALAEGTSKNAREKKKEVEPALDSAQKELRELLEQFFGNDDSAAAAGSAEEKGTRNDDKDKVKTKPVVKKYVFN